MSAAETSGPVDLWEAPARPAPDSATFIIELAGFEGPLDLLLSLARTQKVDLAKISISALAEQYLAFIGELHKMRLEIAADYLVMAAWLTYLKSRLLLPEPATDEPSGEELAAALAFRLRRLETIRDLASRLAGRPRLDRDIFSRGAPEPIVVERQSTYSATLYDLLSAYAAQRRRNTLTVHRVAKREVLSLSEARQMLANLIGRLADWMPMEAFLTPFFATTERRRTVLASTFAAGLELVREGRLAMRQTEPFAPLHLRAGPAIPREVVNG